MLFLQKGRIVLLRAAEIFGHSGQKILKRVGNTVFFTGAAFLSEGQCDEAGTGQAGHWWSASSLQVSTLTSREIFLYF